jgi:hypothetical protein
MQFEMNDVLMQSMTASQITACHVTGNPTTCCISSDPMIMCTNANELVVF